MFAAGTTPGSEEKPVTVRFSATVSRSPTVKANGPALESSEIVCGGIEEASGRSFTEFTVRRNELVVLAPSGSLTTRVMLAVPNWLLAGKIVTERLLPLPLNEMFSFGTRPIFDEKPWSDKFATTLSTSPT